MSGSGHSVPVEVFIPSHKLQDMSVVIYKYKEIIIQTCLWMASSTSEMRSLLQCFLKWFILEFGSSTTINFSKSESDCELWDYPWQWYVHLWHQSADSIRQVLPYQQWVLAWISCSTASSRPFPTWHAASPEQAAHCGVSVSNLQKRHVGTRLHASKVMSN